MSKLEDLEWLFNGRHFDREVIILCVRWYLRYKLSFRDLAEIMAERGLSLVHTTIMRWVRRYTPEFVKRWNRFAAAAGQSWRVDETYVKIRGKWTYLYRAVASHRAVREMKTDGLLPQRTRLRSSKYLNNPDRARSPTHQIAGERDARFKRFRNAAVTISSVELMRPASFYHQDTAASTAICWGAHFSCSFPDCQPTQFDVDGKVAGFRAVGPVPPKPVAVCV
jgi:transposase-like protein